MQGEEIETYLDELGRELEQQFTKRRISGPLRVLVIGGVFMVFVIRNRGATEDIDTWIIDEPTDTYDTANLTPPLRAFKAGIWAVAKKHNLKRKWCNDVSASFVREMAPDPNPTLWKRFGPLEIWFPDEKYVLALKIVTFRDKDREDVDALLQRLHITRRAEAQVIIDTFIPDKGWQAHYDVEVTLDELFYQELLEDEAEA